MKLGHFIKWWWDNLSFTKPPGLWRPFPAISTISFQLLLMKTVPAGTGLPCLPMLGKTFSSKPSHMWCASSLVSMYARLFSSVSFPFLWGWVWFPRTYIFFSASTGHKLIHHLWFRHGQRQTKIHAPLTDAHALVLGLAAPALKLRISGFAQTSSDCSGRQPSRAPICILQSSSCL